jgi:hypothetical protein
MSNNGHQLGGFRIVIIAVISAFCTLARIGYAQTNQPVTNAAPLVAPGYSSQYSQREPDNANLNQKVDKLAMQVEVELRAAELRNEAVLKATDRSLSILTAFGAIAGLLGAISIVVGWYKEKQHRADYESERNFYEERVKASDSRFAEMLPQQIDNITKLGGVIGLIEQTYKHQRELEEERNKEAQKSLKYQEMIEHYLNSDRKKYDSATTSILEFKDYSAMQWTRLTDRERKLADRARNLFANVPDFLVQAQLTDDTGKSRLARILQLFGVSAFYAKEIESAAEYLERAKSVYSQISSRAEDVYSRAYTDFFLGLIEKNWRLKDRSPVANLKEAKTHLEAAWNLVAGEKRQLLIPVTLAEIGTYIDSERDAARIFLDEDIIPRLEGLRDSKKGLDGNQMPLLLRSYLLRGNIEFIANRQTEALAWYGKGRTHDPANAYPILSAALAAHSDADVWRNCLKVLDTSGALSKFEETVRVTALAWGVIAAHYAADVAKESSYLEQLKGIGAEIRPLGGRVPLFFCPMQKTMVEFGGLMEQLDRLR